MEHSSAAAEPINDEWCQHRFDYQSPALAPRIHETLEYMRGHCPVAHSELYNGHWIVTGYEDVLKVAQDWRTFSSAHGVSPLQDPTTMVTLPIPELVDPPLHREYKRLINHWFTPAIVLAYEAPTRALITRLIDDFVEAGECDFMAAFARPFPGLAFFDLVMGAPTDELMDLYAMASAVSIPGNPGAAAAWQGMARWISGFIDARSAGERRHDVIDAILHAEIEGRPITRPEMAGLIQLLIFGGLETTAGALGQFMLRFCNEPAIPELLRARPELLDAAIEELLRLEGPFLSIGRTVMADTTLGDQHLSAGDKLLIYFASANRDEHEFPHPHEFDLQRASNRHITFGAGPHRCAGSNLARMNLRIALEELIPRLVDVRLQDGVDEVHFHSALNRAPLALPIRFTPGTRKGEQG